jgi:hypothetical protein
MSGYLLLSGSTLQLVWRLWAEPDVQSRDTNDWNWVGSCRSYIVDGTSILVHIRPDQTNNFGGSAGGTIDHFGSDGLYKTIG